MCTLRARIIHSRRDINHRVIRGTLNAFFHASPRDRSRALRIIYMYIYIYIYIHVYIYVCEVHSSRTLSKKSCTRFSSSQLSSVYWWFFCIYFISKDMLICIFKDGPGKFLTSTLESQTFQDVIYFSLDVSRKLYIWVSKFPGRYTSQSGSFEDVIHPYLSFQDVMHKFWRFQMTKMQNATTAKP